MKCTLVIDGEVCGFTPINRTADEEVEFRRELGGFDEEATIGVYRHIEFGKVVVYWVHVLSNVTNNVKDIHVHVLEDEFALN